MTTIKILPEHLANKIAAGEVVQRPAAAIKELFENSIDAKSTSITVIVKDGGKALIHVIDNGIGMSREDAELSFARHATSKIATYEDLECITTLGFRGEALASISAVAHVELKTRRATDDVGTKIRIEGSNVVEVSKEATAPGTSILVRNLFFNTPGRRNFLKSTNTEFKHIFDVIQRLAIAHPEIAFSFTSDGESLFDLRPSSLAERVRNLFGEKLSETIFAFEDSSEFMKVSGFLGKPDFARKTRIEQYLFLNKRYIVNRSINHAVFKAYEHLLEKGSFPFFILFLEVDPHKVDVNVHPSKMEVKFEEEHAVYRCILSTVRKALSEHDLVPLVAMREETSAGENLGLTFRSGTPASGDRAIHWRDLIRTEVPSGQQLNLRTRGEKFPLQTERTNLHHLPDSSNPLQARTSQPVSPESRNDAPEMVSLWQVHNKYIVAPVEQGLMVVDQHAAHERVLYERAILRFSKDNTQSQQLLFPQTIELTSGDAALVKQLLPHLEGLGFTLKLFGKTTIILDGIPIDVKPGKESTILQELLDLFKEDEHDVKLEPRERLAKSYSCKAAIKAGDPLNDAEMHSLLDQLFATEIPYVCPHGRPVIIKLSLSELDRRFGRTS